jgi:hypothetical protein
LNNLDQKYYDDFTFNLRYKLTSDLILKYKEHKYYNNLLTLIKSDLYEDLILAREIINKLAI